LVHGLIELDAREFDQLSPLLGFVGDELAELGWQRRRSQAAGVSLGAPTPSVQPRFVPVVWARTRAQLVDLLGTLERPLTPKEVEEVEVIVLTGVISGSRYQPAQMAHLDSEK
jgi:hypothetical protein